VSGDAEVARRVRVTGRVQGVFFRASTRERARENGVAGWVRNRDDGSVEAWLEGPSDAVETVERWMRDGGPRAARVEQVESEDQEPEGLDRFEVRR
jgi:acylphosphatase